MPTARITLLLAALLLSGCVSFELSSVRGDLASQLPEAEISSGHAYSFGAISLGLARLATRLAGVQSEEVGIALRGVRRVQVARYEVSGEIDAQNIRMPTRLRRYLDRPDWTHLASVRKDDQAIWVLYRTRGDEITSLFVTVLTNEELVLTRINGNLSGIVLDLLETGKVSLENLTGNNR